MTKIKNYPLDNSISAGDKLIGTDETGDATKNFSVDTLKSYINTFSGTLQDVTENGATSDQQTDFTNLVNGKVVTYDGEAVSVYRGLWNAATNTPALSNTDTGKKGWFYKVSHAGTVDFGQGSISFNVGDYVSFEVDVWNKFVDNNQVLGYAGFVRYDGAQSFDNSTEITVGNGSSALMIDADTTPVVSFNGLDVYFTRQGANKPTFNFSGINQVYVLTVVFKARTANTNAAHIDLRFSVSGNTSYTRLSKSIDFYKGNNQIQNFHEVFQFYTDQDLVDNGMSLSLDAVGEAVEFGDVIYFIQRCI